MTSKTEIRVCTKCNLEKEANTTYFYKNKSYKDGLSSWCKECYKVSSYGYYIKNKDKQHKQKRDRYNKDEEHRKDKAIKMKAINDKNRSKRTEYARKWQQENKNKLVEYRITREMNKSHEFSNEEWIICKEFFYNSCAYCGISEEKAKEEQGNYLHKEHVNHTGSNGLENCVPSCKSCNSKKWKFSLDEWYSEENSIYNEERFNRIQEWLGSFLEDTN